MIITELKEKFDKINNLLNDPHPGLIAWQECIHNSLTELTQYLISQGYGEE